MTSSAFMGLQDERRDWRAPRATTVRMPAATPARIRERVVLAALEHSAYGFGDIAGVLAFEIDPVLREPVNHVRIGRHGKLIPSVELHVVGEDEIVAPKGPDRSRPGKIEKPPIRA